MKNCFLQCYLSIKLSKKINVLDNSSNIWQTYAQQGVEQYRSGNYQDAAELFAQPDINGGLVGGASLKAQEFLNIAQLMA